jgi:TrmH family RNA methyltransferase
LLPETKRDGVKVVLVSPRNPLNIGAAARAMANFGLRRLTVVAPYEEHWREAKSAIGAEGLLQNAGATERLEEAVANCSLVLGTAAVMRRKPEQAVIALPELASLVEEELERGGRVAVVFGPEKRGLTREDLSYCHRLVEIPTDKQQPSMNLGQAVAVVLYELAGREPGAADPKSPLSQASESRPEALRDYLPASAGELERLAGVVEEMMLAAEYSPAVMRNANRHDVNLMLRRLRLNQRDARRIVGLFRSILRKIKDSDAGADP